MEEHTQFISNLSKDIFSCLFPGEFFFDTYILSHTTCCNCCLRLPSLVSKGSAFATPGAVEEVLHCPGCAWAGLARWACWNCSAASPRLAVAQLQLEQAQKKVEALSRQLAKASLVARDWEVWESGVLFDPFRSYCSHMGENCRAETSNTLVEPQFPNFQSDQCAFGIGPQTVWLHWGVLNVGCRWVVWYPIVMFFLNKSVSCPLWGRSSFVRSFSQVQLFSGDLSTFIHLSLGKAGPFTLENLQNARLPK